MVVERFRAPSGVFYSEGIPVGPTRNEVFRVTDAATVVEAWRERLMAAAVEADFAIRRCITSANNIEQAGRAQPVLRGQGAGKQRYLCDKIRVDKGAQSRHTLRNDDAIDPGLNVRVFASDVKIGIGGS